MVKEGMKSVKGRISSIKLKTAPILPIRPPNVFIKMNEEIGAQIISETSAKNGMLKLA